MMNSFDELINRLWKQKLVQFSNSKILFQGEYKEKNLKKNWIEYHNSKSWRNDTNIIRTQK